METAALVYSFLYFSYLKKTITFYYENLEPSKCQPGSGFVGKGCTISKIKIILKKI